MEPFRRLEETEGFCTALEGFNAALRGTSLFVEEAGTEKAEIGAADMAVKLGRFADACGEGRSARIKAAVKELEGLHLANDQADGKAATSTEFDAALAETLDLARSLDYDEAAEKARAMIKSILLDG